MVSIERKLKHITSMKRTVAELNRRIASLEREIQKDMLTEYAAVNNATAG